MTFIPVTQGGDLMTDLSKTFVGPSNYVEKWNVRRKKEGETLMPGYEGFFDVVPFPQNVQWVGEASLAGGAREIIAATPSNIYRLDPALGEWFSIKGSLIFETDTSKAHRWEAVLINGHLVFNNGYDLPCRYRLGETPTLEPLWELREVGIVRVGTIWVWSGFLWLGDITEIQDEELDDFLANALDPYTSAVPDSILTFTPFRVVWTDDPRQFRVAIRASAVLSSNVVTMAYPVQSLSVGDRVNVTTDPLSPESGDIVITEAIIRSIAGTQIELEDADGNDVVSPANGDVFVTRSDYAAQIVGFDDPVADGARILRIFSLGNALLLFRENSIVVGRSTGDAFAPVDFQEVYSDRSGAADALAFRWTLTAINDNVAIYRGREGWHAFDLLSRKPRLSPKLEMCADLWPFPIEEENDCFAAVNTIDKEIWLCPPAYAGYSIVYDYENDRVYLTDETWRAAATVRHPVGTGNRAIERLFLMADGAGRLSLFAKSYETGDTLYTRRGEAYTGRLRFGFLGDEKDSEYTLTGVRYSWGRDQPRPWTAEVWRATAENNQSQERKAIKEFPAMAGKENLLPTFIRGPYLQDRIEWSFGDIRFLGRHVLVRRSRRKTRGYKP